MSIDSPMPLNKVPDGFKFKTYEGRVGTRNGDHWSLDVPITAGNLYPVNSPLASPLVYPLRFGTSDFKSIQRHFRRHESDASVVASILLGETVVTNDRVLNHALQQAGNIIGRRDISALDKFEMLAAYVLKSRREILGKPED